MARFELHVGSAEFWERARGDLKAARKRVLVQAMTFEGDAAGSAVGDAILAATAADRRILVDDYTRHVINDRFLTTTNDPELLAEAQATWAMFDAFKAGGVGLRLTNPVGRNPLRYASRNHKKLLVIDDTVWLGGINFSDHNFAWHDMMVRIEDRAAADWLAAEFERDWSGKVANNFAAFPEFELLSLDGSNNAEGFVPLLTALEKAETSIEMVSAYPTFPFVDVLARAARRGVAVTLFSPGPNNKPVVRDYLLGVAANSGINLRLTPMMSHAKAALIDGVSLVTGSSNFDFVSHRANAEYIVTLGDPGLIGEFRTRVLDPLSEGAVAPGERERSGFRAFKAKVGLKLADFIVARLSHGKRIKDWRG